MLRLSRMVSRHGGRGEGGMGGEGCLLVFLGLNIRYNPAHCPPGAHGMVHPKDERTFRRVSQPSLKLTVSPLIILLLYCHINGFQRACSVEKPLPGGENRMAGWAAHPVAW